MTHEEKVNYLRIALGINGIGVDEKVSDVIVTTYETILKKGGEFNIRDAAEIQCTIDGKYKEIEIKAKKED